MGREEWGGGVPDDSGFEHGCVRGARCHGQRNGTWEERQARLRACSVSGVDRTPQRKRPVGSGTRAGTPSGEVGRGASRAGGGPPAQRRGRVPSGAGRAGSWQDDRTEGGAREIPSRRWETSREGRVAEWQGSRGRAGPGGPRGLRQRLVSCCPMSEKRW